MSHMLDSDSDSEQQQQQQNVAPADAASPGTPPRDDATLPYIPSSASPPDLLETPKELVETATPKRNKNKSKTHKQKQPSATEVAAARKAAETAIAANDNDNDDDDGGSSVDLADDSNNDKKHHQLSDVDDYSDDDDDDRAEKDPKKKAAIDKLKKLHEEDDADEDDPFLKGSDGKMLRRPLGTKKEIRELTELSRKTGDYSFAEGLEPDAEGYKPVTWKQLRHNIGFEKVAHKFKVHGKISLRDQANWDKIKRVGVQDAEGTEAFLYFYDGSPEKWEWEDLTVGAELAVKSPRFHRFMDGSEGMRVESCATVCDVKPHMVTDEERLSMGKMHKEHGNKKFGQKLYEDAIDKYDEAIRCLAGTFHDHPELEQEAKELAAACHLNIAAAFAGEKKWGQVEAPCRRALKLNASVFQSAKAHFRIGQAQKELGNLVNATAALERALELQPGEPRVLQEMEEVRKERFELTSAQKELFRTKAEQKKQRELQQQQQQAAAAAASSSSSGSRGTSPHASSPHSSHDGDSSASNNSIIQQKGNLAFFDKSYRFGYQRSVISALSTTKSIEAEFDSVENIRDVAATSSLSGPIKKHLLYRSATLVNMSKSDLSFLTERLGIKTVIDLRALDEVNNGVSRRKKWIQAENLKRSRVRLEMRKAEIEVRERRDKGEKISSSSGDDDGSDDGGVEHEEEQFELGEDGQRCKKKPTVEQEIRRERNRVFRRRMRKLEGRSTFSIKSAIAGGGFTSAEEQEMAVSAAEDAVASSLGVPIEDYDEMIRRQDPSLRPLSYVDLESHFHRVSVKCKQGCISSYQSKDYDEFLARCKQLQQEVNGAGSGGALTIPSREEWQKHEPLCLHIDFSSNTIFSLASYWVWVVVLLLGLLFQVQWAAWVIVQMTAARVGALSYYKSMLQHQRQEIREVFELLADEANFPVLVCCEMGKDRTGVLVALILMACGASKEFVCQDYARSRSTDRMVQKCGEIGLTTEDWLKALPKTMDALVTSIDAEGGIESYLLGIGVTEEMLQRVRANLCESA